jgi:hypothetical protein
MSIEWYFMKDGMKHGPISSKQLKQLADSGKIQPTDLIWKQGFSDWRPAAVLTVLFDPTANRAVEPDHSQENMSVDTSCKKPGYSKVKRSAYIGLLAASGILLLGGFFIWTMHRGHLPATQSSQGHAASALNGESHQKRAEFEQQQTHDTNNSISVPDKDSIIVKEEGDHHEIMARGLEMKPTNSKQLARNLSKRSIDETFSIDIAFIFDPKPGKAILSLENRLFGKSSSGEDRILELANLPSWPTSIA